MEIDILRFRIDSMQILSKKWEKEQAGRDAAGRTAEAESLRGPRSFQAAAAGLYIFHKLIVNWQIRRAVKIKTF